jgi:hypothetical protein
MLLSLLSVTLSFCTVSICIAFPVQMSDFGTELTFAVLDFLDDVIFVRPDADGSDLVLSSSYCTSKHKFTIYCTRTGTRTVSTSKHKFKI